MTVRYSLAVRHLSLVAAVAVQPLTAEQAEQEQAVAVTGELHLREQVAPLAQPTQAAAVAVAVIQAVQRR
jgi:hypothetical protein